MELLDKEMLVVTEAQAQLVAVAAEENQALDLQLQVIPVVQVEQV
jgi:hypothetical protein